MNIIPYPTFHDGIAAEFARLIHQAPSDQKFGWKACGTAQHEGTLIELGAELAEVPRNSDHSEVEVFTKCFLQSIYSIK